jgi:lysyl endopeptidase
MYRIRFTFFFLLLTARFINAQIQYQGEPVKLKYPGMKTIPVIELKVDKIKDALHSEKGKESRLKPDEFAYAIAAGYSYENYGVWDTLDNGIRLWRLGIFVQDAVSLNIIFTGYNLAKGVKVFIYDKSQKNILGALTYRNNKEGGILATSPVYGDFIYIEMQVPAFIINPGKLTIGQIGAGYDDHRISSRLKDQWYGTSGSCNEDINCIENKEIQKMKYSVCRIVYAGKERCTGALINNVKSNGRPFVLTAQHCLSTQYLASTAIFYFDYESPYCDGPDGNVLKSISGGDLVATTDNRLDFSLVELSVTPPFSYKPYYAGWNNQNIPPANSYTIHHPQGDVKKISFDDDEATTGNFGEGYDTDTHWLISDWESGTTEQGSSGCPLINQNGRIVGTLTGGDADCQLSVNDYFQKFCHTWDDYSEKEQQLKSWLDPQNSNVQYIDGFDPYESIWQTGDTISNITDTSNLLVHNGNLTWGYISGHNSDSIRFFAEKFNISEKKKLFGVFLNVASLYYNNDQAIITVNVWNGENQPKTPVIQKEVLMIDLLADELNFIEFDSVVSVSSNFYVGYQLEYNNPLDSFAVFFNEHEDDNSNSAMINYKNNWIPASNLVPGNTSVSFDIRPLVFDTIYISVVYDTTMSTGDIKMIPVLANNIVEIEIYEWPDKEVTVNIYSLNGQLITSELYKYPDKVIEHNIADLKYGIYIMEVVYKNYTASEKIPVLR